MNLLLKFMFSNGNFFQPSGRISSKVKGKGMCPKFVAIQKRARCFQSSRALMLRCVVKLEALFLLHVLVSNKSSRVTFWP